MRVYKIKQNKRKIYTVIFLLLISGVLLLMTGLSGLSYSAVFQFFGVICLVTAVAIYDRYLSGGFEIAIDERRDDISVYPKLYIYTTKGRHNITNVRVCIPFNKVVCVQRADKVKRFGGVAVTNLTANMDRGNICYIEYEETYSHSAVYCNADDTLFGEIVSMSEKYSGLEEIDGM